MWVTIFICVRILPTTGDTLHFSGHDLVDGTPVLDIKPYVREYDSPPDRLCARSTSSVQPAGNSPPTVDVSQPRPDGQTGPIDGTDRTEPPQSPEADVASRPWNDKRESLAHSDDVGRFREDSDAVPKVRTEEGLSPSPRRSDPHLVVNTEARSSDESKSQPAESSQERATTDVLLPDPHTASPACAGEAPVLFEHSSDEKSGATWLSRLRPEQWTVSFTTWAESQLQRFSASEEAGAYRLRWLRDATELQGALEQLLTADPRSVYRRAQNDQLLYHVALDASHVTCWFDPARRVIEVLRLQPLTESPLANLAAEVSGEGDLDASCVRESSGDSK